MVGLLIFPRGRDFLAAKHWLMKYQFRSGVGCELCGPGGEVGNIGVNRGHASLFRTPFTRK